MNRAIKRSILIVSLFQLAACAVLGDRRDAPWDPKGSAQLIDQIPAWDGAANKTCGAHLDPEVTRREGRSTRC